MARQAAEGVAPPPSRGWANSSLLAGVAWLVLAMLPVPMTSLLGLPFAGWALLVGLVSVRESRRLHDRTGAWRGLAGMGLGCGGFVWLATVYVLIGGALIFGVGAFLLGLINGTPAP
jgi:hypothetical protein